MSDMAEILLLNQELKAQEKIQEIKIKTQEKMQEVKITESGDCKKED